jgi:hypothetical protein
MGGGCLGAIIEMSAGTIEIEVGGASFQRRCREDLMEKSGVGSGGCVILNCVKIVLVGSIGRGGMKQFGLIGIIIRVIINSKEDVARVARSRTIESNSVYTKTFVEESAVFSVDVVKRRGREVISGDVISIFGNGLDDWYSSSRWCSGRILGSLDRSPSGMWCGLVKGWARTQTR